MPRFCREMLPAAPPKEPGAVRCRLELSLAKQTFWGEHRPSQQSELAWQASPLAAHDFGAEVVGSGVGAVELEDAMGDADGMRLVTFPDGAKDGLDDGVVVELGVVFMDGVTVGLTDGVVVELRVGMEVVTVGLTDGVVVELRVGMEVVTVGLGDGSSVGVGVVGKIPSGEGASDNVTCFTPATTTSGFGTLKRKDSVFPDSTLPVLICCGGSETTMANSIYVPRKRSRLDLIESSSMTNS